MTTIYMIRHAEAEGNRYRRIHGQYNSVVTARGWKQIAALAKRFSNTHIDAVYSSDLTRTKMTASSIYKTHGLPLNTTTRLHEVCMGVWEDEPWGEAEQKEPEQLYCFNYDPENWTIEGREDIYSLRERIKSVILDIAAKHDGETVAVFTHGCAIRAFLSYVKGDPPKTLKDTPYCDNTAVAMLHVRNEEIEIVYDGDNAHLPKELSTFHKQHWWEDEDAMDRNNLWYQEYDPASDSAFYHDCLADTDICGPDEKIPAADPAGNGHSAFIAMCDKSPAGIIELKVRDGYLSITFCLNTAADRCRSSLLDRRRQCSGDSDAKGSVLPFRSRTELPWSSSVRQVSATAPAVRTADMHCSSSIYLWILNKLFGV